MSEETLEKMVKDFLGAGMTESSFAWQGGEPTLMGLDFYKKTVELQKKYASNGQTISNALQTNAIVLDEQWCSFLNEYNFLVGISLDGPQKYHDHYRLDRAGGGTFERVKRAIELCRKFHVQFNILILLNKFNGDAADEIFDFFLKEKIRFLQFIPCVEKAEDGSGIADFSITPEQYGNFLCRLFDRWLENGPEKISIRLFDSILHYCLYGQHTLCTLSRNCNDYVVVEHNGDVFCCDFFVEPRWKLGNIHETPIAELASSEKKRIFARTKSKLANQCLACRHLDICRGGCMKDRVAADDYHCTSYFCQSYKRFFDHSLPQFKQLAAKVGMTR